MLREISEETRYAASAAWVEAEVRRLDVEKQKGLANFFQSARTLLLSRARGGNGTRENGAQAHRSGSRAEGGWGHPRAHACRYQGRRRFGSTQRSNSRRTASQTSGLPNILGVHYHLQVWAHGRRHARR